MIQNILDKAKTIHFIGIGGIGMSAIAKLLHDKGYQISGSDLDYNAQTQELEHIGANIYHKHDANNIESPDLVVYSLAIPNSNPELEAAKSQNIPCLTYPQALGEITKDYKLIAVAGTHGKTTTTGMLSQILIENNYDPTIIIGSTSELLGNENYRFGNSEWMLIEACEYHQGFLHFHPEVTLITNLEHDHFDAYPTEESYLKAFQELLNKTKSHSIINTDLPLSQKLEAKTAVTKFKAGTQKIELQVPGDHNNTNAIVALRTAEAIGIDSEQAKLSLKNFKGTGRRLEFIKEEEGQIFYDDYGHHPTEIKAVLKSLKQEYPSKSICIIFQAHQHNRTEALLNEFVKSFELASKVIIPNIYKARDTKQQIENMTAKKFAEEISKVHRNCIYSDGLENTKLNLKELTKGYNIVLVMGAGDVFKIIRD